MVAMKAVVVLLVGLLVVCEAKKKDGVQEDFEFVEVRIPNVASSIFPGAKEEASPMSRWLVLACCPTPSPRHPTLPPNTYTPDQFTKSFLLLVLVIFGRPQRRRWGRPRGAGPPCNIHAFTPVSHW